MNRHREQAIEAEFEAQDKSFSGNVQVTEVNGPDIKSENNFGKTDVKSTERTVSADGKKMKVRFAPHSFTMLKTKLV